MECSCSGDHGVSVETLARGSETQFWGEGHPTFGQILHFIHSLLEPDEDTSRLQSAVELPYMARPWAQPAGSGHSPQQKC